MSIRSRPIFTNLVAGVRYPGVLYGTVKIAGVPDVPVLRKVYLFEVTDPRGLVVPSAPVVRWQQSSSDGIWQFDGLDPAKRYGAIAYDNTGVHDPVIKLNLVPEVPAP